MRRGFPGYFFLPLTAAFNVAPALNFGAFDALILTFSPVRGLTPWRAARLTTENLPKPVIATSSPFFSDLVTVSSSDSTARVVSAFVRPASFEIASINCDLFMSMFLSSRCARRARRVPRQLLSRVEQALRVKRVLDLLVQLHRPRIPLRRQSPALVPAHAVLARHRPAQL